MAEMTKKKEGRGYRFALTSIKGLLRLLIYVCLIVVLIYIAGRAYALGHEAFAEEPVDIGEGRTVVVTITEDMSTYQIGRVLKAEGLLQESAAAFWLQEFVSEYHNQILPGSYSLKTSMTTQEMFPILAQADRQTKEESSGTMIAPGIMETEEEDTADTESASDASSEMGAADEAAAESTENDTAAEIGAGSENEAENGSEAGGTE